MLSVKEEQGDASELTKTSDSNELRSMDFTDAGSVGSVDGFLVLGNLEVSIKHEEVVSSQDENKGRGVLHVVSHVMALDNEFRELSERL